MAKAAPQSDAQTWSSEVRSEEASKQLKALAEVLGKPGEESERSLAPFLVEGFEIVGLPAESSLEKVLER